MRALFLLHGAPASGKTTLIRQLSVQHLTLGYDTFRELFSTSYPCIEDDDDRSLGQTRRMTPESEKAVVEATHAALKSRFAAGTTVFFDATSARGSDQDKLARMAAAYGYQTHLIDCQGETSLETLLERNRLRGDKRVIEQAVAMIHERCAQSPIGDRITSVIDGSTHFIHVAQAIEEITAMPEVSAENVIVVGDVHSCAQALAELVEQLDDGTNHWVFAGDLFDRGPDPVGVWKIVQGFLTAGRGTVVTGNHEEHLRAINTHVAATPFRGTRKTRDELLGAGILAGEQIAFVDSTVPALLVHQGSNDATWLITHGGVGQDTIDKFETDEMLNVSDAECIYGLGDREHTYRGKTSYNVADMPLAGYQLHGHRNAQSNQEPVEATTIGRDGGPIVCLEAGAASGGHVRAARIIGRTVEITEAPDHVDPATAAQNALMPWERKKTPADPTPEELLERMRTSEHVKVQALDGITDVVACNFTRKAFADGVWDELTVHARGLFINEKEGTIAARGYEKFFHIGEAPGRTLEQWMNASITSYPVVLRKKYNGYLALVASIHGKLEVFSKSGITSYSRFAREMLIAAIGEKNLVPLAGMLERTNTTAAFEVIAARDTHPITEKGPDRLVLLDCIRNQVAFDTDDSIRTGISARFGFDVAKTMGRATSPETLETLLKAAAALSADEGVVLVDARGYRSKVKTEVYAERKAARTALERVWRGKTSTLGQRLAELEGQLIEADILPRIDDYTVTGVDGNARLDLARIFDDLERHQADRG